eukprot:Gb_18853 [translate_table: standard]
MCDTAPQLFLSQSLGFPNKSTSKLPQARWSPAPFLLKSAFGFKGVSRLRDSAEALSKIKVLKHLLYFVSLAFTLDLMPEREPFRPKSCPFTFGIKAYLVFAWKVATLWKVQCLCAFTLVSGAIRAIIVVSVVNPEYANFHEHLPRASGLCIVLFVKLGVAREIAAYFCPELYSLWSVMCVKFTVNVVIPNIQGWEILDRWEFVRSRINPKSGISHTELPFGNFCYCLFLLVMSLRWGIQSSSMAIFYGEFHRGLLFLSLLILTSGSPVNKIFSLNEVVLEDLASLGGFSHSVKDYGKDTVLAIENSLCNSPLEDQSCEGSLKGIGSLNTTCQLNTSLYFDRDLFISGQGNLEILSHVSLICPLAGCLISINISGDLKLGSYASLIAGTIVVAARNVSLEDHSSLNTTALGGPPPAQTSGTPLGVDGAGGGHGGRGACCIRGKGKDQEDIWGGDVYAWSTLTEPWSFGSRGGTTATQEDLGGGGGGRIMIKASSILDVNGTVSAEGGNGRIVGGGGSGGSIILHAPKLYVSLSCHLFHCTC